METQYRKGNFEGRLAFGRIAEGEIAQWLVRAKNYSILPAYEIEYHTGKGPRLLTKSSELIAPDLYAIKVNEDMVLVRKWIEAKHKERFSWHRNSGGNWQTGIDITHYEDYLKVRETTKTPVYILFLHRNNKPSQSDLANGSPDECPVGLFCGELGYLRKHEHHRDSFAKYGRTYPMVYWNHQNLKRIATLEEVNAAIFPKMGVSA
jgi:hypothetical protein